MSAWSFVRSWLGVVDGLRGEAAGPRRAAPTFRPMLEELESREAPGALLGGVAQSPLSLLGSASPSGGAPARTNPVPAAASTVSPAASVTRVTNPTGPVKAAVAVQNSGTGQTAPSVAGSLFADPLAMGDFTDDNSSAGPALLGGVQAGAGTVTDASASSGAPVAAPRNAGQTFPAQPDDAGLTNTAAPAGKAAPATARPNSGYDGSQPLLDLAYGLPYGTPISMQGGGGENGGAPARGTAGPSDFPFLEFDVKGRVLINVHSTQAAFLPALQSALTTQAGFTATEVTTAQNMVTGWLPINQILNLPNFANFDSVTPVYKSIANVGSYPTDADLVIHSDTFRSANNVDGTGVNVGVISDSANEVGGGLAASEASGDVAPNVQLLADDPSGAGTDEGRAMLEIVHHIAPGASEAFFTGEGPGASGIADAINGLAGAGAKVITDDLTDPSEPMFNDGLAAQAAENAVNNGIFYTTSAGNNANHGYLANWQGITATVGGVNGTFQDITGGNDPLQTFTLGVGDTVTLAFDWDSAFLEGGGTGNYVVPNDLQALVTNANGTALSTPQVFNSQGTNTNEAFQFVQFTNTAAFNTTNFAFSFNLVSGPAPTMIRWVSLDDGDPTADPHALMEGAPTSFGHATATGVVTTAAANFQTPTVPETFSALGGNIPILFDNTGARLATPDIRVEPVVTAPDGVQTSFFDQQQPNGTFLFFGTSAATPHVAAAAALLMQQAPTATVADVTQYLEQNALDINTPGRDSLTGFGLIQLTSPLVVSAGGPEASLFPDDRFEPNETSDRATQFGVLAASTTTYDDLTINIHANGLPDYDWYRWSAGQAGTFTATETTTLGGNLELHLFTLQGNTLVDLADSLGNGTTPQMLSTSVADGQAIFVEIKGQNDAFRHRTQAEYTLEVTLA